MVILKAYFALGLILICVVIHSCSTAKKVRFEEINYGISASEVISREPKNNSPSGYHLEMDSTLNITKRTDTVETKLGAQFGIEYKLISSAPMEIPVQITWTFPQGMKDINGKEIKQTKRLTTKMTNEYNFSNYMLEGENELVKGDWVFEMRYKDKRLYKKTFYLK
jgi:hypothetical protein